MPEELRSLPAGQYVIQRADETLTPDEEQGPRRCARVDSNRQGRLARRGARAPAPACTTLNIVWSPEARSGHRVRRVAKPTQGTVGSRRLRPAASPESVASGGIAGLISLILHGHHRSSRRGLRVRECALEPRHASSPRSPPRALRPRLPRRALRVRRSDRRGLGRRRWRRERADQPDPGRDVRPALRPDGDAELAAREAAARDAPHRGGAERVRGRGARRDRAHAREPVHAVADVPRHREGDADPPRHDALRQGRARAPDRHVRRRDRDLPLRGPRDEPHAHGDGLQQRAPHRAPPRSDLRAGGAARADLAPLRAPPRRPGGGSSR